MGSNPILSVRDQSGVLMRAIEKAALLSAVQRKQKMETAFSGVDKATHRLRRGKHKERAAAVTICDLSDDDIIRIVTDLFAPKKITDIKRHKWDNCVSCTIYKDWVKEIGSVKEDVSTYKDRVVLRNPFENDPAIRAGRIVLKSGDLVQFKQFCFAKGIKPDWFDNNPYLAEEEKNCGICDGFKCNV